MSGERSEASTRSEDGNTPEARIQALEARLGEMERELARVSRERDQLRDEHQAFQRIVDNILDALLVHDFNGRLLDANRGAEMLTGYTREELLSLTLADIGRPCVVGERLVDFREQDSVMFEGLLRRKDGTEVPVSVSATVVSREGNGLVQSTTRDISALERSQSELRKYQTIVEFGNFGSALFDLQGTLRYVNPTLAKMLDREQRDMLGQSIMGFHPASMLARAQQVFEELLRTGRISEQEIVFRRRDGSEFPALVNAKVVFDDAGEPSSCVASITEITALRDAQESEVKFHSVVKASPMGIHMYALDDNDRLVFTGANPAADALLGVDNSQFVGKVIEEAFPSLQGTEVPRRYLAAAAHGEQWSTEQIEYEDDRIKGAFEVHAFQTAPRRMAAMFLDISERKRMEARLRQSEKMEAIGQLAGGIAHDFNNQLTGIMGFAELLAAQSTEPSTIKLADKIVKLASRSAGLTNQLLTFARKGSYRSVVVDVHAILAEVVEVLEQKVGERIQIAVELGAAPCTTLGDPAVLQNAFLNLGINACDAMPNGGTLFLQTGMVDIDGAAHEDVTTARLASGRYLLVRVSDTGTGMSAETRRHIFEPFFTTKSPGRGTGMGLAAVYGAVRLHKGAIGVDSSTNQGTCFRVYLPTADGVPAKESDHHAISSAHPHPVRVLFVDDDPIVRDVGAQLIRCMGHEVQCCANGRDAVALYAQKWREFDVVIVDLVMPDMDGRHTFRAMREINPSVIALLTSGYSMDGQAHAVVSEGMYGFLEKPFRLDQLAAMLSAAMAKHP